jgi:hypothetical protein
VSQLALLTDVHVQPLATVTDTLPVLAAEPTDADVDERVGLHELVAPLCDTEIVCPATVSVPARLAVDVLAAAV